VRLVVFGVQHLTPVVVQRATDLAIHEELFLDPQGPRHPERSEAFWRHTQVGLEDPLELEQRLVVETDVGELRSADAAGLEAIAHRVDGKRGVSPTPGDGYPCAAPCGTSLAS